MPGSKPGERRGGRQKGTPNKATADIKAALRMHGDEFVEALIELTKSKDERVRLGALQVAFDRGQQCLLLGGAQAHPLVVALGEREQGTHELVAVLLEGGFDPSCHLVGRALLPSTAPLTWF